MGAKYLFVINSFLAGGAERSLLEMLPGLTGHGITPIIACLRYRDVGFEEEVRDAGYDVRLLDGKGRLAKIRSLRRLIADERPDLVYTSLFDADLAGRLAAIGSRVPVISNLANTAYDPARLADPNVDARKIRIVQWVDGVTARRLTTHFHAVSEAVKESTVETLKIPPERITVVKRGRDRSRLGAPGVERRAEVRRRLGIDEDAEVVVTVGRQEYQKGHHHLVEAFAAVVAARPQARLLVVGRPGHASDELTGLVTDLGLESSVTLLGHRSDVPDILAASDLFVFPSRYEGLGGALIEAMAMGLPVVASDIPALREVVVEGENADLVPPGDVIALTSALTGLLADAERRHSYGQRSRERFDEEFHTDVAVARMIELLAAVAAGSTGEHLPSRLDDVALAEVLAGLHDRTGPLDGDAEWSVVDRWRSFKADFVHIAGPGTTDVALKFGHNWGPDDPRFVFEEVGRVGSLFADLPGGQVRVPSALGWSASPEVVALEYAPGDNLFAVLADEGHALWAGGVDALARLMIGCGQAIGAYHAAQPAIEPMGAVARGDLLSAARRSGVRRSVILAIEGDLALARGYRFSPNDFTVDAEGRLVMLDPPHVLKYDPVHRDISAFTFELHRFLIGERPSVAGDRRTGVLAELRTSFLAGYADTGPALSTELDEWMIRFYEVSRISGHAYGKLRRRNPAGLAATMRWATSARRRLGPPP